MTAGELAATITVLVVPVEGPIRVATVNRDARELCRLIDTTWLESLESAAGTWSAWLAEDRAHLPENTRAREIATSSGWHQMAGDVITGDVFFAGPPNDNGQALSVPDFFVARARALYGGDFSER